MTAIRGEVWGEVWVYKTSLTQPLFIEVPVPSQVSEWAGIYIPVYVLGVTTLPLFLGFCKCSNIVTFFF